MYEYFGSSNLGSFYASIAINAVVVDASGNELVLQPTINVIPLGGGVFGIHIIDMPTGHGGWVLIREGTNVLDALIISVETEPVIVQSESGGGPGAVEYVFHVRDYNNVPLENVNVWVTSDESGKNVIAGTFTTNYEGNVTLLLNPGSYWVWCNLPGYNFENPERILVQELILQS